MGTAELKGLNREQVEGVAAAVARNCEKRLATPEPETTEPSVKKPRSQTPASTEESAFFQEAKARFLQSVETSIGAARRVMIEDGFRLAIEPFFLDQHQCPDPRKWPPLFDLFQTWTRNRARRDDRKGRLKARTANNHIAILNKFLKFCREVYGMNISSNCKRFGKQIIDREHRPLDDEDAINGSSVWTEAEFATFRELAYKVDPYVAPIFDAAFGLGLRRGEAIALRTDAVHLDDTRMGPLGYVQIVRQYTWDAGQRKDVLKRPKWGRTRTVPIPYHWLQDALRERMSGRATVRPRDNAEGLRYVAERYSKLAVAKAMGVSDKAVGKWMESHSVDTSQRHITGRVTDEQREDIREHLLFGRVQRKPKDYLFTDENGRLPVPDRVEAVFQALIKHCGLKKIRLHDLRHSFGTIWAERVSPTVLKEMMGHSSILTTERYIHTTDEIFRRSMEQVLAREPEKDDEKT